MKPWVRYLICGVAGLALGAGAAVQRVRTGALGASTAIGPWTTGKDFGTTGASAFTRAVVSLRGILALPAHEARYYNAAVDSAGEPLDGKCKYRVTGKAIPGEMVEPDALRPSRLPRRQSGQHLLGRERQSCPTRPSWTVVVAPAEQAGLWLPTGRIERFELTLQDLPPR